MSKWAKPHEFFFCSAIFIGKNKDLPSDNKVHGIGFVSFGPAVEQFSTFSKAISTLMVVLLGEIDVLTDLMDLPIAGAGLIYGTKNGEARSTEQIAAAVSQGEED